MQIFFYVFKNLVKLGVGIFFFQNLLTKEGFQFFMQNFSFLRGLVLFLSKRTTSVRYFLENEGEARGHQAPSPRASTESTSLFHSSLPTSYPTGRRQWRYGECTTPPSQL